MADIGEMLYGEDGYIPLPSGMLKERVFGCGDYRSDGRRCAYGTCCPCCPAEGGWR